MKIHELNYIDRSLFISQRIPLHCIRMRTSDRRSINEATEKPFFLLNQHLKVDIVSASWASANHAVCCRVFSKLRRIIQTDCSSWLGHVSDIRSYSICPSLRRTLAHDNRPGDASHWGAEDLQIDKMKRKTKQKQLMDTKIGRIFFNRLDLQFRRF